MEPENENQQKVINVAENLVLDKGTMTVSTKLMKYAVGALIGGTITILGFAWGLYLKVEGDLNKFNTSITTQMGEDKEGILTKIKELDKEEVEPNTDKNTDQDMDIVRLFERVDSRYHVNDNYRRPPSLQPTVVDGVSTLNNPIVSPISFEAQNVVETITDTPTPAPNAGEVVD